VEGCGGAWGRGAARLSGMRSSSNNCIIAVVVDLVVNGFMMGKMTMPEKAFCALNGYVSNSFSDQHYRYSVLLKEICRGRVSRSLVKEGRSCEV